MLQIAFPLRLLITGCLNFTEFFANFLRLWVDASDHDVLVRDCDPWDC